MALHAFWWLIIARRAHLDRVLSLLGSPVVPRGTHGALMQSAPRGTASQPIPVLGISVPRGTSFQPNPGDGHYLGETALEISANLLPNPVARVIAIANQKGGVGKTTTAVNLAASLALAEKRTLLIDGDPQGNATSGIGVERGSFETTTYHVLLREASIAGARRTGVQFPRLDVLPATPDLAGAEIELVSAIGRDTRMREAIALVRHEYDFILIDCPPSLGLITLNMLAAANTLLIPLQCEYYALEGLSQLLNTVHLIQHGVNPSLGISGVLLTMYDARLNLSRQVAADAREYFGTQVFNTVVPRNVRLAEAPGFGKPIVLYDVMSIGAQAYMAVANELIAREAQLLTQPHTATERDTAHEASA